MFPAGSCFFVRARFNTKRALAGSLGAAAVVAPLLVGSSTYAAVPSHAPQIMVATTPSYSGARSEAPYLSPAVATATALGTTVASSPSLSVVGMVNGPATISNSIADAAPTVGGSPVDANAVNDAANSVFDGPVDGVSDGVDQGMVATDDTDSSALGTDDDSDVLDLSTLTGLANLTGITGLGGLTGSNADSVNSMDPANVSTAPPENDTIAPGSVFSVGDLIDGLGEAANESTIVGAGGITPRTPLTPVDQPHTTRKHSKKTHGKHRRMVRAQVFSRRTSTATMTDASTDTGASSATVVAPTTGSLETRAYAVAQSKAGSPYVWGAEGPTTFDCSGLVQWSYGQVGVTVPRTAQDQFDYAVQVPTGDEQPGDLVFFHDSTGHVYHVGFYAGNGELWNAPHTGAVVREEPIWTPESVTYGRFPLKP